MKRVALILAILLPLVSGCDMKGIDQDILLEARRDKPVGEKVILSAYVADGATDTKTSYNWSTNKILWNPGDKISLFYGSGTNGGERFTSTLTESSDKSDFSGTISIVSGVMEDSDEKQFWGIYPYSQQNEAAGSYVTVTVQHEQTAAAETFAQGHFISIGRSPGLSMGFYNLCGAFYVKFTRDDIVSVKFRGKGGQPVAGRVKVGMNSGGKPEVQEFVDQQTEITLSLPGGEAFTPGVGYYIVSLPAVFSDGFEFEMTTAAGYKGTKSANINFTLARNAFQGFKKAIDDGVAFTKEGNIDFADANVKAICVDPNTGWDTDHDGELSYTEAAAVTTIPYGLFNDNTTITLFDEFQYFTGVTSLGYDWDNDEGMDYYGAFSYCSALTSIILPSSLHDISFGAFRGCSSLESITIPSTVTRIGQVAFEGCKKLVVTMESETPCTLYRDTYDTYDEPYAFGFLLTGSRVKAILVPTDDSVTAYQAATYWSSYSSRIHKVGWVDPTSFMSFKDDLVELYCVGQWDTDGDGYLSYSEAAAVTDIGTVFKGTLITSFDELKYFTGISGIPANAFNGCKMLGSISFPPQISSIGSSAFAGTTKLKKISVPTIDMWLDVVCASKPFDASKVGELYLNNNLVTILSIPSGRTRIPAYTGYYLDKVQTVIIPSSVTSISSNSFINCVGLSTITIPSSVTTIYDSAFAGCINLTDVDIPQSVESIESGAFSNCTKLNAINIPLGVTTIGSSAFSGCANLVDVYISPSVTTIGSSAFAGCSKLNSISIPSSVKTIENFTFEDCSELTNIVFSDDVTSIGNGAFRKCTKLSSFVVPEGVTSLSPSVFAYCSSLSSVILPSTLQTILGYAFKDCISLTEVVIPNNVNTIGEYAFSGCTNLTGINIPDGMKYIYRFAFENCTFKSISLPQSIERLWTEYKNGGNYGGLQGAFVGSGIETIECYSNLIEPYRTINMVYKGYLTETPLRFSFTEAQYHSTNPDLPEVYRFSGGKVKKVIVKGIGSSPYTLPRKAFSDFTSLEELSLPRGMVEIEPLAFSNCGFTTYNIPSTVRAIGSSAFKGCVNLTNIVIPDGVEAIEENTFWGCTGLENITISDNVTVIRGGAFYNCKSLTGVTLPSELVTITDRSIIDRVGYGAFQGCSNILTITIPEKVSYIGNDAFAACTGLTSISIPASVTSIGNYAFANNIGLTSIYVNPITPPTGGSSMFYNTNDAPIYVPSASVDAYKEAEVWNTYASRIQAIPE